MSTLMLATRLQPRPYQRDARAYVLVEEARLRCEALRAAARDEARGHELRRLHRELGLAGLYASANVPSRTRRALLGGVHDRCDQPGASIASTGGLLRTMRRALRAARRSLTKDGPADHMELARLHLLRAMEFLTPTAVSRPSLAQAFRPRHVS